MFQRYVLFATLGVMSAVLAACSNADSSTDPRTQPPLVRSKRLLSAGLTSLEGDWAR